MRADPLIGQVLHDTHEVVRLIGRGGMGAVYEARHVRLRKQRFAIKVLQARMKDEPTILSRFQREAEIATEIGHPNIIYVLDFYESDDGRPCMVMEYLEGEDLNIARRREGRFSPDFTLKVITDVGSALTAVHEKGIVHRDLKPGNIFLARNPSGLPRIKVLDFGISKIRDSRSLTGTNDVLGTPQYMSPEQGEGDAKAVDHRTDIFALGTITYLMLSGSFPFNAPTLVGVIRAICDRPHRPLGQLVEGLGDAVEQVLARALAKRKEERYQRVSAFVEDLSAAMDQAEMPLDEKARDRAGVGGKGKRAPAAAPSPEKAGGTEMLTLDELVEVEQAPELVVEQEEEEETIRPRPEVAKRLLAAAQSAPPLAAAPEEEPAADPGGAEPEEGVELNTTLGAALGEAEPAAAASEARGPRPGLMVGLITAAVVVAGFGGALLLAGGEASDADTTAPEAMSAAAPPALAPAEPGPADRGVAAAEGLAEAAAPPDLAQPPDAAPPAPVKIVEPKPRPRKKPAAGKARRRRASPARQKPTKQDRPAGYQSL